MRCNVDVFGRYVRVVYMCHSFLLDKFGLLWYSGGRVERLDINNSFS